MGHFEATELMKDFEAFFAEMPDFVEVGLLGRVRFVREYPDKNLRIYIVAPLSRSATGLISCISRHPSITFEIQHNKKTRLEFGDSRAIEGWQKIAKKKIRNLEKLIKGSQPCTNHYCEGVHTYPIIDSAMQGKLEATGLVVYECPKCKYKKETKYGIGLKNVISRCLKPLKK